MNPLTVGRRAKKAGIGVETTRFHDREGPLTAPARAANGCRHYDLAIIDQLRFVRGDTVAERFRARPPPALLPIPAL